MAHTITSESTLFQLDFGWIDFCFSMLLYCYLVMTKRKSFFVAGIQLYALCLYTVSLTHILT